LLGQRRAIDRDERLARAGAQPMHVSRN